MPRRTVLSSGGSVEFNGTSSYGTLPITPASTFTVCFWMKKLRRDAVASDRYIDWQDSGPSGGFTFTSLNSGDLNRMSFAVRNSTNSTGELTIVRLPFNEWVHIAVSYSSTSVKVYANGSLVTEDTDAVMSTPTQTITIARRSASSANFSNIRMSNLMWFNSRILSASEISEIYSSNKPAYTPTAWIPFSDGTGSTAVDVSGNGNDVSLTSSSWSTDRPGGVVRVSSGSRISLETSIGSVKPSLVSASGVFTASISGGNATTYDQTLVGWFKPIRDGSPHFIGGIRNNSTKDFYMLQLSNGRQIESRFRNTDGTAHTITSNYRANEWGHFALRLSPATLTHFYNGTPIGYTTVSGRLDNTGIAFGAGYNTSYMPVHGLYDVFLYNRGLSDSEILDVYKNGPVVRDSVLVGWRGDALVSSPSYVQPTYTSLNTGMVRNVTWSTDTRSGLGRRSIRDSGNRSLNLLTSGSVTMGSSAVHRVSNITMECWVNPSMISGTNYPKIFWNAQYASGSENGGYAVDIRDNGSVVFAIFNNLSGFDLTVQGVLKKNEWSHLVTTYDGSKIRIYINGLLQGETAFSGGVGDMTGSEMSIGANDAIRARIQDMRVYSRALTPEEVYSRYKDNSTIQTIGWWRFSEGSGTTSTDLSGNGNDATVPNSWSANVPFVSRSNVT